MAVVAAKGVKTNEKAKRARTFSDNTGCDWQAWGRSCSSLGLISWVKEELETRERYQIDCYSENSFPEGSPRSQASFLTCGSLLQPSGSATVSLLHAPQITTSEHNLLSASVSV
ncbi:hypothetical protein CRENBAI_006129 [Crenichthys baileyi]|uniref:Uncharacterized protein n=1 Tax=Crenichthys baileyi TaxID=28760 RepID=A0AAV9S676_9TELE